MSVFDVLREKLEEGENKRLQLASGTRNDIQSNLADCYSHAIEIVNQVEQEYNSGWIPCSERLPEDNQDVLIFHSDNSIGIDRFKGEKIGFECDVYNDVIAWQPLPPKYEPKGE